MMTKKIYLANFYKIDKIIYKEFLAFKWTYFCYLPWQCNKGYKVLNNIPHSCTK